MDHRRCVLLLFLTIIAQYAVQRTTEQLTSQGKTTTAAEDNQQQLGPGGGGGDRDEQSTLTTCRNRLAGNIEACLAGYERALVSSKVLTVEVPQQLPADVVLLLCSEYEQTMQCLHERLSACPPDEPHLYLIAYRLAHVKLFMEQTCHVVTQQSTSSTAPTLAVGTTSFRSRDVTNHVPVTPSSPSSAATDTPTLLSTSAREVATTTLRTNCDGRILYPVTDDKRPLSTVGPEVEMATTPTERRSPCGGSTLRGSQNDVSVRPRKLSLHTSSNDATQHVTSPIVFIASVAVAILCHLILLLS